MKNIQHGNWLLIYIRTNLSAYTSLSYPGNYLLEQIYHNALES